MADHLHPPVEVAVVHVQPQAQQCPAHAVSVAAFIEHVFESDLHTVEVFAAGGGARSEGTWILARAAQRRDLVSGDGRRCTVWAAADGDTVPAWVTDLQTMGAAGALVSLPISGTPADDDMDPAWFSDLKDSCFAEEAAAFAVRAVFAYTEALCALNHQRRDLICGVLAADESDDAVSGFEVDDPSGVAVRHV